MFRTPTDASGNFMVAEIDPSGLREWVDYIPVQINASPGRANSYDNDGYFPINTDGTGVAWVDYTPVVTVENRTIPFAIEADGYIPVVDNTPT